MSAYLSKPVSPFVKWGQYLPKMVVRLSEKMCRKSTVQGIKVWVRTIYPHLHTTQGSYGGTWLLHSRHFTHSGSAVNANSVTVLVQVSAYGFITSNYQKFSDHYFERIKKPLIFYVNHDLSLEATLWKDLHKAGILWLYQR